MSTTYTIQLVDGTTFGPIDAVTLRGWAEQCRIPPTALIRDDAGNSSRALDCPLIKDRISAIACAPPMVRAPDAPETDSGMSKLIPYKNVPALVGYYLSVGSLIPLLALLLGPAAVILGFIGFRHARMNPNAHGRAHCWVAVILGSLTTLAHVAIIVAVSLS